MWPKIRGEGTLDGSLSWLVAFACFIFQFVVFGFYNNYGLLFVELLKEHKDHEVAIAWVGSISFGVLFHFGPMATSLASRFGCRAVAVAGGVIFGLGLLSSSFVKTVHAMYITYSLLLGAGSSFCFFSSILILREYFSKRLALVNGIGLAGSGFGTLAIAPLMNTLLDHFHWRQTLRIVSAMSLLLVLGGFIFFVVPAPIKLEQAKTTNSRRKFLDVSVFKNKAFVVWVAAVGLVQFGFYIPFMHLVRHSQDLGIEKSEASLFGGVIAMSQTIGKVFFGQISDNPRVDRLLLFQMALLVCSVMTTLLPLFTSFGSLMVYSVVYGLHDGCFLLLSVVLTGDIAGRKNMASAFGLMYMITSVPLTIGPPVAGWIYESTRRYEPAFYMAGACTTLAVCLLFSVPWLLPPDVRMEWRGFSSSYEGQACSPGCKLKRSGGAELSVLQGSGQTALWEQKAAAIRETNV